MLNVTLAVKPANVGDFVLALARQRPHASADFGLWPMIVTVPQGASVPPVFNLCGFGHRLDAFDGSTAVYLPGYCETQPVTSLAMVTRAKPNLRASG